MSKISRRGYAVLSLLSLALAGVCWWRINYLADHVRNVHSTWYEVTYCTLLAVMLLSLAVFIVMLDEVLAKREN